MSLQIDVRDNEFLVGRDEDGCDVYGLAYSVIAINERGERWAHERTFVDRELVRRYDEQDGDEYTVYLTHPAKERAEALAKKIAQHLARGGNINLDHWTEIDPMYGSVAYQELDNLCYFRDCERNADLSYEFM